MNKLLLLLSILALGLAACGGEQQEKLEVGMPKIGKRPGAAFTFEQLLYENNYNAVPLDDDPAYYVNDILDSALIGLAYK